METEAKLWRLQSEIESLKKQIDKFDFHGAEKEYTTTANNVKTQIYNNYMDRVHFNVDLLKHRATLTELLRWLDVLIEKKGKRDLMKAALKQKEEEFVILKAKSKETS